MPRRKQPRIPDAILDQLLAGADPKTAFDPNGLLDDLKKPLAERALNAEMAHFLAPTFGFPTGLPPRWDGRGWTIRSASLTSFAMFNMQLMLVTRPLLRA